MVVHNNVPTTCTASQLTNWSIPNLVHADPKVQVNARLRAVEDMRKAGFKRDFAMLFAITTQSQIDQCGLEEFMPLVGFEKSFRGVKSDAADKQRHQETGDLTMWCTTPKKYEDSLNSLHAELTALKDKIDPPKKPDPKRQAFPEIKGLARNGIVRPNVIMDNIIADTLLVTPEVARRHIKMKFGIDFFEWQNRGDAWTRLSYRQLRSEHARWKAELI